jgi:glycosyltransferase involved in cell wall biosynthesis
MLTLVHVTHEAVQKIGGIGSVLEGLITAPSYIEAVARTILLCPLFTTQGDADGRLGPEGEVLYSSIDGRTHHPLAEAFRQIQQRFHVEIVYGRRLLRDPLGGAEQRPEVILIDVGRAAHDYINAFKHRLFESFGLASTRYEHSWDFEQYVRLAEPGLAAVRALGAGAGHPPTVVVAHEFMGVPAALAAKLHPEWHMKTAFYAHEVAPVRKIVEEHPGHDTMFYNVLRESSAQGKYIDEVFGDQSHYFRHALVVATRHLDVTLAVGDEVVRELRFLCPEMAAANIRLTYNGIPAYQTTAAECAASKARLQDHVQALLGHRPDYVFTHVTRMVPSKGLWRDIGVMKYLDEAFRAQDKTAALIVLSTEIGGPRRREDILHMEKWWDWPVAHREGMPDLSAGEAHYHAGVQAFNARSRNCKVVYINQFGFDRASCGERMPREMQFWDIRKGSDLEFGQSIYEPFGIAQLEALSFGCLCVMSSICGCAHFVRKVAAELATGHTERMDSRDCLVIPSGTPNVIIADYTAYPGEVRRAEAIETYKNLPREVRAAFDDRVARQVAGQILARLPRTHDDEAAMVRRGYELADRMSWEVIASEYVIPALREIITGQKSAGAA